MLELFVRAIQEACVLGTGEHISPGDPIRWSCVLVGFSP